MLAKIPAHAGDFHPLPGTSTPVVRGDILRGSGGSPRILPPRHDLLPLRVEAILQPGRVEGRWMALRSTKPDPPELDLPELNSPERDLPELDPPIGMSRWEGDPLMVDLPELDR
jgi:hypothetical protein